MERIKTINLFAIVILLIFAVNAFADFSPPLPEPGTATVDGDYSEWNLTDDIFTDMWEAGKTDHPVLSKCYLRYDCTNEVLYILVLAETGIKIAANDPTAQWVKIHDIQNNPIVDGNSGNDGTPPDFEFINQVGDAADGWEASVNLAPPVLGTLYNQFHVHAQVDAGLSSTSTSASITDTPLDLDCSALPVELTSFNVTIQNQLAQLKWETATEVNNYGFEVQRTSETNNWAKIGFVEGHGNSNSPKYYSFTDNDLLRNGDYSYRLKQIDIDGKYEYSDVVNVTMNAGNIEYKLDQNYPNPFNPTTTITYSIPKETHVDLIIYNVFGEEVARLVNEKQSIGNHSVVFNASEFASGIYLYTIKTDNYISTRKLLLLK